VASLRTVGTNAKGQRRIPSSRRRDRLFQGHGKLAPETAIEDLQTAYQGRLTRSARAKVRIVTCPTLATSILPSATRQSWLRLLGSTRHAGVGGVGLLIQVRR